MTAATAPVGTVVADTNRVYLKNRVGDTHPWQATNGGLYPNTFIDQIINSRGEQAILRTGWTTPAEAVTT